MRLRAGLHVWSALAATVLLLMGGVPVHATVLGVQGPRFSIDGKPAFLLGFSYYSALGASEYAWRTDLDSMQRHGFNWIRVWATWRAFDNDVSAVDAEGAPREPYLSKLRELVAECDRRRMVVDVTLSRGDGRSGSVNLPGLQAHERAVETLVGALKRWRNWYLDLANEGNIGDARHVPVAELARLRDTVKRVDAERLVTASHGGNVDRDDVRAYLVDARLDFLAPHRPRDARSPAQTETKTAEVIGWIRQVGKDAPIHYQEPFRRGYGDWQPQARDFAADLAGARKAGAAGWCFHNGSARASKDGRPRRSFDLRDGPLMAQLDAAERGFLGTLGAPIRRAIAAPQR